MRPPLLVVVTGMPSSGKTTIAEALSRRLRVPVIAKDEIKEHLHDALGAGDVEWSTDLGKASYALTFTFARTLLALRRIHDRVGELLSGPGARVRGAPRAPASPALLRSSVSGAS